MVDFIFYRFPLKIRQMGFGSFSDTKKSNCDVVYMHSNEDNAALVSSVGLIVKPQYTLVNDISIAKDELLKSFKSNYRNEIRRAEKEGATSSVITGNDSPEDIKQIVDRFEKTYNDMFEAKGMSNRFNRNMMMSGLNKKQIIITIGIIKEYTVFHAYQVDGLNAVLMYSASPLWENGDKQAANLIGWVNKYLHWNDMLWMKDNQFLRYEWGGVGDIDNPSGIAKFKMGFGGELVKYNNYIVARSIKGYLYIFYLKKRSKQ